MLGAVGISTAFDWESERINYDSVRKNFDELELVRRLRMDTVHCDDCGHRLIIDRQIDGIVYCSCAVNTCSAKAASVTTSLPTVRCEQHWQPYLERPNVIIWRREEQPGLFAYKGLYNNCLCYADRCFIAYHENIFFFGFLLAGNNDNNSSRDLRRCVGRRVSARSNGWRVSKDLGPCSRCTGCHRHRPNLP